MLKFAREDRLLVVAARVPVSFRASCTCANSLLFLFEKREVR